jgi:predicted DNA-binding protein YlxM (UPF0122 family)
MPRQKRSSRVLEYSEQRLTALLSIQVPEVQGELSVGTIQESIERTRAKLNEYNATLSLVDQLNSEVKAMEKSLLTLNDRMLSSIAAKYGRNSSEYVRVGSVRANPSRRRAARSTEAVAPSVS